jgi:hypothetical protein
LDSKFRFNTVGRVLQANSTSGLFIGLKAMPGPKVGRDVNDGSGLGGIMKRMCFASSLVDACTPENGVGDSMWVETGFEPIRISAGENP